MAGFHPFRNTVADPSCTDVIIGGVVEEIGSAIAADAAVVTCGGA